MEETIKKRNNNRKNAVLGAAAAKLVRAKKIEYEGVIYLGYNELLSKTGISKFLYKKYYLKGFDPRSRKGKDGPLAKNDFVPLRKENQ